ncbi:MAG: TerB family tellurite resistance protein [Gammaproteobacteria bacterium]|nr:TerB family tellurite resistance protein [Gammaproteobacteria bacterium]
MEINAKYEAMENKESKHWFAGIETIVSDPLRFKARLAIGEDAYKSLRLKKAVLGTWDTAGAAWTGVTIAKSTVVATTFFAPTGILAALGFGTAVTPLGWVIAAGVLTGGAWLGITHYFKSSSSNRAIVIPDFINTPMDVLALSLFDLLTPLSLIIANVDGHIDESERTLISNYFVKEWGYDQSFVTEGMHFTESRLSDYSIKEAAKALAEFKKQNPDCNYKAMSKEILSYLQNIIESNGRIDEDEEMAIEMVKSVFEETGRFSVKKTVNRGLGSIKATAGKVVPKKIMPGKKR